MDLDQVFDAALLAKKKKKKKNFDLDVALGICDPSAVNSSDQAKRDAEQAEKDAAATAAMAEDKSNEFLDLENFGKKKKKKKKAINLGELTNDIETLKLNEGEALEEETPRNNAKPSNNDDDFTLDMDFSMSKKKKKNKKKDLNDLFADGEGKALGSTAGSTETLTAIHGATTTASDVDGVIFDYEDSGDPNHLWANSERDYSYDELLKRAFNIMYEKNPDLAGGRKAKFIMRPPQVLRVGTKKTSFANFLDIAKTLHRIPKHLMDFVLAELGTSGSMDGNQQLIIKGRFQPKQIENVLRRYIKEYVTCHTCRSPETVLQKDTRLYFLQCEVCGSRCSVATIKSGFQALTGKRAAIRARFS